MTFGHRLPARSTTCSPSTCDTLEHTNGKRMAANFCNIYTSSKISQTRASRRDSRPLPFVGRRRLFCARQNWRINGAARVRIKTYSSEYVGEGFVVGFYLGSAHLNQRCAMNERTRQYSRVPDCVVVAISLIKRIPAKFIGRERAMTLDVPRIKM